MRALHWFRNDLRLRDNRALAAAAERAEALLPVFVLDDRLLRGPSAGAARVRFLLDGLARLARDLEARGSRLLLLRGAPERVLPRLAREGGFGLVSWSPGPGPFAARRDAAVRRALARVGVASLERKDAVLFAAEEIRSRAGGAYGIYTPYRRAWEAAFAADPQPPAGLPRLPPAPPRPASAALPTAAALGLRAEPARLPTSGEAAAARRLDRFLDSELRGYAKRRDLPAEDATSRLSPYLRFGMISVRSCLHAAREVARREPAAAAGARRWIDQLVWRDFYAARLEERPELLGRSQRPELDTVKWNDDPAGLAAWCEGRTGFPIVDAGMRQLAAEGWMHNRVRMIAASFLVKDLLLDWRLGERFFFRCLVDGDPASNDGGWQWVASTGSDAQPWFRIFNPVLQGERFDPSGRYVRRYVPELVSLPVRSVHRPWEAGAPPADYPAPIVSHAERRGLALARYRAARSRARRPPARGLPEARDP